MKILLDENVPMDLVRDFLEHECSHVNQMNWSGIVNGRLLTLAEENGFLVLVTADQNISSQQKMDGRTISLFVLRPHGQGYKAIQPLVPGILESLKTLAPGQMKIFSNRRS